METQPGKKTEQSSFLTTDRNNTKSNAIEVPPISLPKGGGAIKSIDDKFQVNAANGTAGFSIFFPFYRFSAKVSMSNALHFDHPDHFNVKYVKLADLDGSGTTGIVYLGKDSFKVYFDQSGSKLSDENIVPRPNPLPFPKVDDHTNVNVIDLLDNGAGYIAWSSSLPQHAGNPLRYIDLMGGRSRTS